MAELGSGVRLHDRAVAGLAQPGLEARGLRAPRLAARGVRPQRRPALVRDRAGLRARPLHARRARVPGRRPAPRPLHGLPPDRHGVAGVRPGGRRVLGLPLRPRRPALRAPPAGRVRGLRPARGRLPGRRARLGPLRGLRPAGRDVRRCPVRGDRAAPLRARRHRRRSTGCAAPRCRGPTSSASRARWRARSGSACWTTTSADAQPQRAAQEAIPSHVCGLPAQHQPSLRRRSLSQIAVTRRSPQREPGNCTPRLRAITSGWWVTSAMPSSSVSGERSSAASSGSASSGVTPRVASPSVDVEGQVGGRRGHADPRDRRPAGEVVRVHHREGAVDPRERLQRRCGRDEQERDPPGRAPPRPATRPRGAARRPPRAGRAPCACRSNSVIRMVDTVIRVDDRPRVRDRERTRRALLDAALAEFSEKGFAGARVSAIAARAGRQQAADLVLLRRQAGAARRARRRVARGGGGVRPPRAHARRAGRRVRAQQRRAPGDLPGLRPRVGRGRRRRARAGSARRRSRCCAAARRRASCRPTSTPRSCSSRSRAPRRPGWSSPATCAGSRGSIRARRRSRSATRSSWRACSSTSAEPRERRRRRELRSRSGPVARTSPRRTSATRIEVVELPGDRDEVRHEVEREREVGGERREGELPAPRHARVAQQPPGQHEQVRERAGERPRVRPPARGDEREQRQRVDREARGRGDEERLDQAAAPDISASALSTSSSCVLGDTFGMTCRTTPSASMMNVARSAPQYVRPYIDFSAQTP